jgi:hypothetical protein
MTVPGEISMAFDTGSPARTLSPPNASAATAGLSKPACPGCSNNRRLIRRYERKAEHFQASTDLGCALLTYRRWAKATT